LNTIKTGKIFVFSAPSGAGKTTLMSRLKQNIPELVYSISATTRKPRAGEVHGTHYFFFNEEEFKKKIDKGDFAEWALVHGNYYGTPRSFIDATIQSGHHIIMDIDVQGKLQLDKIYPDAVGILILPPTMEELENRLRKRGSEDDATLVLRLKNARTEVDTAKSLGKYEHHIINDDFNRAAREIESVVRDYIGF
jgi:guanylate kinase